MSTPPEFEPRKVRTTWNPNRGALAYTGYDRPEVDDRLEIIMTKACIKKEGGGIGLDHMERFITMIKEGLRN